MPSDYVPQADPPTGGGPFFLTPSTYDRHAKAVEMVEGENTARYPRPSRGRTTRAAPGAWGFLPGGQMITGASGLVLGAGTVTLCSQKGGALTADGEDVQVLNSGGMITGPARLLLEWTDGAWSVCECAACGQICVLVQDLCGPQPGFIQYIKACDYWIDTSRQTITDANGSHSWLTAQSWVSAANATSLIPFNTDNIWNPTPVYESVLWCSACGGSQLLTAGATGTDDLASLTLTWYPLLGYFQSQDLFWNPASSFFTDDGSYYLDPSCSDGSGSSGRYFYRVFCDGDNLRCELWTHPVELCPYSGPYDDTALCGYYLGDSTTGVPSVLVKLLTSTVAPTCDADSISAAFTFNSIDGVCADPIDPPAANVSVVLLKSHCRSHKSGQGAYGYFWTYQPTTVTLTLRVFADLCPGGMPWTLAIAGDAAFDTPINAPSGYFVDYVVAVEPTCSPNYSATFAFSKPATRYTALSVAGSGTGNPPHGTVTLPVTSATMFAPVVETNYVAGAVATMVDQDGATVGTCTTDHSGTCCLPTPSPGQYWVTVSKSGCDCPSDPQTQEVNFCPPPCNESVRCSACGGVELATVGGTGHDTRFPHLKFTYSYALGKWQSNELSWPPLPGPYEDSIAYFIDSVAHTCRDGTGAYADYFYRVFCDGTNLKCELWSFPVQKCPYDDAVCGYYMGDDQYGDSPTPVLLLTATAAPTCDSSSVTATFTFGSIEGVCTDPVPPPSTTVTVTLQQIPEHHVLCCGSNGLPIPRRNLTFTYSGTGGSGSETLVYTPSGNSAGWISANARFGCGPPMFFGHLMFYSPTTYTWVPLYMSWTVGGNTYTVSA